jgi:hypothetical protein
LFLSLPNPSKRGAFIPVEFEKFLIIEEMLIASKTKSLSPKGKGWIGASLIQNKSKLLKYCRFYKPFDS